MAASFGEDSFSNFSATFPVNLPAEFPFSFEAISPLSDTAQAFAVPVAPPKPRRPRSKQTETKPTESLQTKSLQTESQPAETKVAKKKPIQTDENGVRYPRMSASKLAKFIEFRKQLDLYFAKEGPSPFPSYTSRFPLTDLFPAPAASTSMPSFGETAPPRTESSPKPALALPAFTQFARTLAIRALRTAKALTTKALSLPRAFAAYFYPRKLLARPPAPNSAPSSALAND